MYKICLFQKSVQKDPVLKRIKALLKSGADCISWIMGDAWNVSTRHLWSQALMLEMLDGVLSNGQVETCSTYKYLFQGLSEGRSWIIYMLKWHQGILAFWRSVLRKSEGTAILTGLLQCTGPHHYTEISYRLDRSLPSFLEWIYLSSSRHGCFSKYLVAVPLHDNSALSVTRALVKHVYMVFGAPELVVNDRGRKFIKKVLDNVHKLMGIQGSCLTSYCQISNKRRGTCARNDKSHICQNRHKRIGVNDLVHGFCLQLRLSRSVRFMWCFFGNQESAWIWLLIRMTTSNIMPMWMNIPILWKREWSGRMRSLERLPRCSSTG